MLPARGVTLTLTRLSRPFPCTPLCLLTADHFPLLGKCSSLSGFPGSSVCVLMPAFCTSALGSRGNSSSSLKARWHGGARTALWPCRPPAPSPLPTAVLVSASFLEHEPLEGVTHALSLAVFPHGHSCQNWQPGVAVLQPSDGMGRGPGVGGSARGHRGRRRGGQGQCPVRSRAETECATPEGLSAGAGLSRISTLGRGFRRGHGGGIQ